MTDHKQEEIEALAEDVYRASFLSGRIECLDKATVALRAYAALLRERDRDDRVLRSSVPEKWKACASPVGAVQSYIAELELALGLMEEEK